MTCDHRLRRKKKTGANLLRCSLLTWSWNSGNSGGLKPNFFEPIYDLAKAISWYESCACRRYECCAFSKL